jgi:uncharacterized protein
MSKPFAIVTGASSGIGLELATIRAQEGFDLLIAADRPEIEAAADRCRECGAAVQVVEADLATTTGVDQLWAAAAGGPLMRCWPMPDTGWDTPFSTRTSTTPGM